MKTTVYSKLSQISGILTISKEFLVSCYLPLVDDRSLRSGFRSFILQFEFRFYFIRILYLRKVVPEIKINIQQPRFDVVCIRGEKKFRKTCLPAFGARFTGIKMESIGRGN